MTAHQSHEVTSSTWAECCQDSVAD